MSRSSMVAASAVALIAAVAAPPSPALSQCYQCSTTGCTSFTSGRTGCYQWLQGSVLHCSLGGYSCAIVSGGGCSEAPDPSVRLAAAPVAVPASAPSRGPLRVMPCDMARQVQLLVSATVFSVDPKLELGRSREPAGVLTAIGDLSEPVRIETSAHEGFSLSAMPAGEDVRVNVSATIAGLEAQCLDRTIAAGQPATFRFTSVEGGYIVVVRAWGAVGADAPARLEGIRARIGAAAPAPSMGARGLSMVLPHAGDPGASPGGTWGRLKILYR